MIRLALLTDYPSVKDCAKAAFEPYVERMGKEPAPMHADFIAQIQNNQVYVFEQVNEIVAYVVFHQQNNHLFLENIATHPAHSGQGYGQKLIEYVEQVAFDWHVPAVELYTNALMTESISLYKRLGYEEFDRRIEDGFDRLFFRKLIATT